MYLACDVGGTHIRVALFDSYSMPTTLKDPIIFSTTGDFNNDLDSIRTAVQELTAGADLEGLGFSVAGVLDAETRSELVHSPNLPGWNAMPLRTVLSEQFTINVRIANDAACAAVGEALYGAGKDESFLLITWGTGVGGAAVEHFDHGMFVSTFEPGHIIMQSDGRIDSCGQSGCLENLVGGKSSKWRNVLSQNLTENEWDEITSEMALALQRICAIRPTSRILFTGGMAVHNAMRIPEIQSKLSELLKIVPTPECMLGVLKDQAGLYGAVGLFDDSVIM